MKGEAIFSGRFLFEEVDGMRVKRLPLIILSVGINGYALSIKLGIGKHV